MLRKAVQLLQEAGCVDEGRQADDAAGRAVPIEFLLDEPAFQPHHMPYIKNLGTLGIEATLRLVDPVQFRARRDDFDFDMTIERFGFSTMPGDSLRSYFSVQSAATKGSNNLAGIADPVDRCDDGTDRSPPTPGPKLVFACRALDRVIRAGRYWMPQWYAKAHRLAYWDVFGHPPACQNIFGVRSVRTLVGDGEVGRCSSGNRPNSP